MVQRTYDGVLRFKIVRPLRGLSRAREIFLGARFVAPDFFSLPGAPSANFFFAQLQRSPRRDRTFHPQAEFALASHVLRFGLRLNHVRKMPLNFGDTYELAFAPRLFLGFPLCAPLFGFCCFSSLAVPALDQSANLGDCREVLRLIAPSAERPLNCVGMFAAQNVIKLRYQRRFRFALGVKSRQVDLNRDSLRGCLQRSSAEFAQRVLLKLNFVAVLHCSST